MDLGLTGRTAFISGSTEGIGYAVAEALLADGAAVTINGRRDDGVRRAVARLRVAFPGGDVSGLAADFSDPGQVDRLLESLDRVDILVNNVGLFEVAPFAEVDDDTWHRFFEVNVMSGVRLSRHLLPGMLATGEGRILFVVNESGIDVPADMIHYGATKAAMLALGNGLAKLTRGTGVTVNSVVGGPTFSSGVERAVDALADVRGMDRGEMKAAVMAGRTTSLLQRFIEPEEIARTVAYLASPLASATNGAAVRVDGGVLTTIL